MERFGRWARRSLVSGLAAAAVLVGALPLAGARESAPPSADFDQVALSALPREAQATHRLILSGGPFPYGKDGSVFGNRERLLPRNSRGYYREYTVPTPGLSHRGARRIVCGGREPRQPDACYYTQDHYASFKRIAS